MKMQIVALFFLAMCPNLNAKADSPNPRTLRSVFATPTPLPTPSATSPLDSVLSEDYIRTLRDPFRAPTILAIKKDAPTSELETFQLKEFKLNGIISTKKKAQAMLTAPNGKGYFVSVGDHIGLRDGRVTAIFPDALKVVEYVIDEKGKRVPEILELRMNGEMVSLSKKED